MRVPMHNMGAALIYVQSRWKAPTVWDGGFFPNPGLFRKSKFRIWWLFTLRAIGIKIERRKNLTGSTKKRNCLSFKSILILSLHQINKPPLHKLKCTEHWSGRGLNIRDKKAGNTVYVFSSGRSAMLMSGFEIDQKELKLCWVCFFSIYF